LELIHDYWEADAEGTEDAADFTPSTWDLRTKRLTQEATAVCDGIVINWPDTVEGARALAERIETSQAAGLDVHPDDILSRLGSQHSDYAIRLAENCLAHPDSALSPWLSALLTGIAHANGDRAYDLTVAAESSADRSMRFAAARACASAMWMDVIDDRYVRMLRALLQDQDAAVVSIAEQGLHRLSRKNPALTVELAMLVPISAEPRIADDLFMALSSATAAEPFSALSREQVNELLQKLLHVTDVGEYWTSSFLNYAAAVAPRELIQLFLERARHKPEGPERYQPLPYRFEGHLTGFGDIPDRAELLREILATADVETGPSSVWLPHLFEIVSLGHDEVSCAVLTEWLEHKDRGHVETAAAMLRSAHWRSVLDHPELIAALLDAARGIDTECLRDVQGILHASVNTGGGVGTPGEPMPHDVEVRDRARVIADSHTSKPLVREFYSSVSESAAEDIRRTLRREAERE
jgi:hypothetical protein